VKKCQAHDRTTNAALFGLAPARARALDAQQSATGTGGDPLALNPIQNKLQIIRL
jgi:hypothetical protein